MDALLDVDIAAGEYKPGEIQHTCSGICLDDCSGELVHGYSPDASSITQAIFN